MADVRLTATNPEDSSVVPVACNEKGELKLEEIPSFNNVDGDLTVSGSATFAGQVDVNEVLTGAGGVRLNPEGTVFISPASTLPDTAITFSIAKDRSVNNNSAVSFLKNGSALFAGGKCGFTAAGELFVTVRGTKYKTISVASGIMSWEEMTLRDQVQERLDDVNVQIDPNFGVQPETDTGTP